MSGEHADNRPQNNEQVDPTNQPPELIAQDPALGKPRHHPVERAEKHVHNKTKSHAIGVNHADAARREQLDSNKRIEIVELQGVENTGKHRND